MTVKETYDNFILSRQLADLSPKSISDYEQFVSPFVLFLGPDKPFVDIKQSDIQQYLSILLNRPLSKSTRATYIRHVKVYLRWAENEYGASYKARSVKVPKSPKRNVRIYTDAEVKQIFSHIRADTYWVELRNKSIIALMYDSGLRQAEVCGLLKTNISYSENLITVRGKGDKERTVPLGKLARYFLQQYLSHCPYDSEYVFMGLYGDPLTCNAVKLFVSRLATALPFELSSHKLRHNFATNYCLD